MSQVTDQDIAAIKEWLAKQPHLPKIFDDMSIKKFLFSCHNSLERTKQCIDDFCTRRVIMPEIFNNRDPLTKNLQHTFATTSVTTYMDGNKEIIFHVLKELTNKFDFYDCVKAFTLQADTWIKIPLDKLPEDHIVVVDLKQYTLKIEAMPVRLKQVHVINCPSFYETLFTFIRSALPDQLYNLMHFHQDHTGLYKFINQKNLPQEYGGDSESMADQNKYWIKHICDNRKQFMDNNYCKADISQKEKNGRVNDNMKGSFKTLEID